MDLIKRNIDEIINEDELIKKLNNNSKISLYWGTATTGKPHLGYLLPLTKLADFSKAGIKVKILFADLHAYLDESSWEKLEPRYLYYSNIIKAILKTLNVDIDSIEFHKGTDFQLKKQYVLDMFKLMTIIGLHDAKKAGSKVVKQSKNPKLASLIYPCLQALDEEYLDVDIQFGGVDQRKIFMLAEKYLPKINYKKRIHIMNSLIPSFENPKEKMSASVINSKISFLDSKKKICKKINNAFCEVGNIECNPLLSLCKQVLFPFIEHMGLKNFIIKRDEKYGDNLLYTNYNQMENDFVNEILHPIDLKSGISTLVIKIQKNIIKNLEITNIEEIENLAY